MRHWKERWNPDAEFVFNKRMKLGLPQQAVALPGDPVDKNALGLRRLHLWWNAGFIRLAKERLEAPKPRIVRITTKCYEVRVPGKQIIRVNSKEEADATLRALTGNLRKNADEKLPFIEKLNKLMWALHTRNGIEKIKGMKDAVARLHEVARG